jgi:hypothetical protein
MRRTRVHGPDDGQAFRDLTHGSHQVLQPVGFVDVRRPMQRHKCKPRLRQLKVVRQLGARERFQERIDHQVADELNSFRSYPLPQKVVLRRPLRRVEQIRDLVRQNTVDFLWHGAVEAAEARLDVGNGELLLGSHQAAGKGRIHVTDDHDTRRLEAVQHWLEALHHLGRLHRVRP